MKPGPKQDLVREAWMLRFGLTYEHARRELSDSLIAQLSYCRSDECRRLILGISKKASGYY